MRYRDRVEAGRVLAEALSDRYHASALGERPLVLGIPRGGVPVAAEVARALDGDLDVVIARKIGAPGNPEFGIGAVTMDGDPIVDPNLLRRLGIPRDHVVAEAKRQAEEVRRRLAAYRRDRPPLDPTDRVVIVVDDGVATGSTLLAVLMWLRRHGAKRIVAAVPVGSVDAVRRLASVADEVVCPLQPPVFYAVGQWYDDFTQTSDDEVVAILDAFGADRSSEGVE